MPSHDEETVELLNKSEKDLDYSPFKTPMLRQTMDRQDGRLRSKMMILLTVGLLLMTILTIGLVITLVDLYWTEENVKPMNDVIMSTQSATVLTPTTVASIVINTEESSDTPPWKRSRLPTNVVPLHYNLQVHVNLTTPYFYGNCNVSVNVTAPTKYFIVHSVGLNYSQWSVSSSSTKSRESPSVAVVDFDYYLINEYIVLSLDREANAGVYQLSFTYTGMMDDSLNGLYRSSYKTTNGTEKFLALTKFEATSARKVFPCFDEPAMKAVFKITVIHEPAYVALSNMPEKARRVSNNGIVESEFEDSVLMSTYLVCFIVCDFNYTFRTTKHGIQVRVFSNPDLVAYTEYAANVSVIMLDFYADYFGVPYPLPKQDLIAIPDFQSGAMENWGLITFRETALLYNPDESSELNKERVVTTTVHELGHMWFGNIVTMKWWDDLWLNEGFARFLEQLGADHVDKNFHMRDKFIVDNLQTVMVEDASLDTHPIVQRADDSININSNFDHITYSKGAAVIYMLETVIGSDHFRQGLKSYLTRYAFSNARTVDLWKELSLYTKVNVSEMMETWVNQEGYPVIDVRRPSNASNDLTITQSRHFAEKNYSLSPNLKPSPFEYIWEVPLTYIDPDNGSLSIIWLHQKNQTFHNLAFIRNGMVKFNVNNTGFYRVNYGQDIWRLFTEQLRTNHSRFSLTDRTNLLDDVFALSHSGYLNYSLTFELIQYLVHEEDYIPLRVAISHLNAMCYKLEMTEVYPLIRNFTVKLLTPIYDRLGWEEKGDWRTRLLRQLVLTKMCALDYAPCLLMAAQQFQDWKSGKSNISQGLKSLVYGFGIQNSYVLEDWDYMWTKLSDSKTSPEERDKYIRALAYTKEPKLIYKYLSYIKDPSKLRSQDFFTALEAMTVNRVAAKAVWDFIRSEWDNIVKRFTIYDKDLGAVFPYLATTFYLDFHVKEMEDFIAKYPNIGAGQLDRQRGLNIAIRNIAWLNRSKGQIRDWLENHS